MGVSRLRCFHNLLFPGIRFSHTDIVPYGSRPQPGLLEHHAIAGAQASSGQLPDIRAVHPNLTAVHIIEPHQQIDKRCLSAACRAHDGHPLPRLHLQIEILDQLFFRCIAEADLFQLHIASGICKSLGRFAVRRLGFLVNQLKNAGGTHESVLQLRYHTGYLVKGLGILIGITQKAGQTPYTDAPADSHKSAEDPHSCIHQTVYETSGGIHQGGKKDSLQGAFFQPAVNFRKFLLHGLLPGEGLYDLLIPDHFFYKGGLLSPGFRLQLKHGIGPGGYKTGHQEGNRRDTDHHQRNGNIGDQHKNQRSQNGQHPGKQLGKAHQEAVCKGVHIRHDPAHNIAVSMGVKVLQRQLLQLVECIFPNILHHMIGDMIIAGVHHPLSNGGNGHGCDYLHHNGKDALKVHRALSQKQIHRIACENGNIECQSHGHRRQDQGQRH